VGHPMLIIFGVTGAVAAAVLLLFLGRLVRRPT
jgi:hypothetical protein